MISTKFGNCHFKFSKIKPTQPPIFYLSHLSDLWIQYTGAPGLRHCDCTIWLYQMNFVTLSSHFHEGGGTPPHAAASCCLVTQITLTQCVCRVRVRHADHTQCVLRVGARSTEHTQCVCGVGARRADSTSTQSGSHLRVIPQIFRVRHSHAILLYIQTIRSGSHNQTAWVQGRDALQVSCVTSAG